MDTTIHAYQRLMHSNDHPVLNDLPGPIVSDEARHFAFYMWQARIRLAEPRVQRRVLGLMQRFYVPVGTKHQPDDLAHWVSGWLFDGLDGRDAAVRVDKTISKLPGFSGARFLAIGSSEMCTPETVGSSKTRPLNGDDDHRRVTGTCRFGKGH